MTKKVYLGGTGNESTWRDQLIPLLKIDYSNQVVKDWNNEAYERELKERKESDYVLYVITPKTTRFYSIAEVIDDSKKRPDKTIFCVLQTDEDKNFTDSALKSLKTCEKMVISNGGKVFNSLEDVSEYVNKI